MSAPAASSTFGRFTQVGVLALIVAVFAAMVAVVTLRLRTGVHEQILKGLADTLAAVVSMQLDNSALELGNDPLEEVPGALFGAVLKTSKLRGVAGVRVFDANRVVNSVDRVARTTEPPPADVWARVSAGEAIARLHRGLGPEEILGLSPEAEREGVIEAWVPLRRTGSPRFIGAAQFWIEAGPSSVEVNEHDRRLWIQAAIAWVAGSTVIVLALGWAFRRLNAANRELRGRSEDLQRANRELVLAAKTSALGAVTAHLMHELKNPLAGLELFVAGQTESGTRSEAESGAELAAASELTRRLRTMVNDVVGVLRDEQSGATFELTCADVAEIVIAKVQAEAGERGVTLAAEATPEISLAGRRANLATLVLRNLLQNALEATPRGGAVRLIGRAAPGGAVEFLVEDGGGGLPDAVRERLFQPCASTKVGGSGLGLALSHHLAQQAGGRLELSRSDARGTCFRLVLMAEA